MLAKIGADTAENEQHFAEILPIDRRVLDRAAAGCVSNEYQWYHALSALVLFSLCVQMAEGLPADLANTRKLYNVVVPGRLQICFAFVKL